MTLPVPLIATLFWLLAFVCSFPWNWAAETEFFITTLAALFVAIGVNDGAGIVQRRWSFPVSPILYVGGLFWLGALISLIFSDIPYVSWVYFFYFSTLPLTAIFFIGGDDAWARMRTAWQGLRVVFAGLSLYALYQYFFRPQDLFLLRVHLPLADPNSLSAVLSLPLFITAGQVLKTVGRARIGNAMLLLLVLAAFLTTGSRGADLALALGGLGLLATLGLKQMGRKTVAAFIGIAVIAVLVTSVLTPERADGPVALVKNTLQGGIANALSERPDIWCATLEIVKDHPWTGTGIGTFSFYYGEVRPRSDTTTGLMAHNDPLQFAAEMGIASALLFYMIFILMVVRTWRAAQKLDRLDDRRIDILVPFFALFALGLHSHVTYNFHVLPCLMMAGFVFALWYRATVDVLGDAPHIFTASPFLNKTALQSAFISSAFVLIAITAAPIYTQVLVAQADHAIRIGDVENFARNINLADRLAWGKNSQSYAQAVKIPLGILTQQEHVVPSHERQAFIAQARDLVTRGLAANPRDVSLLEAKAQLAILEGQPDQAEAALRDAVRIDPLQLSARMALGEMLVSAGRRGEALVVLRDGLNRVYGPVRGARFLDFYFQTLNLEKEMGVPLSDGSAPGVKP